MPKDVRTRPIIRGEDAARFRDGGSYKEVKVGNNKQCNYCIHNPVCKFKEEYEKECARVAVIESKTYCFNVRVDCLFFKST